MRQVGGSGAASQVVTLGQSAAGRGGTRQKLELVQGPNVQRHLSGSGRSTEESSAQPRAEVTFLRGR